MNITEEVRKERLLRRGSNVRTNVAKTKKHLNSSPQEIEEEGDADCYKALLSMELSNDPKMTAFQNVNSLVSLSNYGFSSNSANNWLYPINLPVRDYQYQIVNTALYNNTLVILPSGCGKSFISSVVLFNICRWYPDHLAIHLCSSPLSAAHELDACQRFAGIDPELMVMMCGEVPIRKRQQLWKEKKVFFATSQIVLADLANNYFDPQSVRCIIVEEAQRSLTSHSTSQVIKTIAKSNHNFRVLATTSISPKDLFKNAEEIFKNLLVSRVEERTEDDAELLPYVSAKRAPDIRVIVFSGYVKFVYGQLATIFRYYSKQLIQKGALYNTSAILTSIQINKSRTAFQTNEAHKLESHIKRLAEVEYDVLLIISQSIEILISNGLISFYKYLTRIVEEKKCDRLIFAEFSTNEDLKRLLEGIQKKIPLHPPLKDATPFQDIDIAKIRSDFNYTVSHPKFKVLKDVIAQYFSECSHQPRTFIFSQYNDSVEEIYEMVKGLGVTMKPAKLVESNATAQQKTQLLKMFEKGEHNILIVNTTLAREDILDAVKDGDLVLFYDGNKSPFQLVRKAESSRQLRGKQMIYLLSDILEQQKYDKAEQANSKQQGGAASNKDCIKNLENFCYPTSPRMVPKGLNPKCYKMEIATSFEQTKIKLAKKLTPANPKQLDFLKPPPIIVTKPPPPPPIPSKPATDSESDEDEFLTATPPDEYESNNPYLKALVQLQNEDKEKAKQSDSDSESDSEEDDYAMSDSSAKENQATFCKRSNPYILSQAETKGAVQKDEDYEGSDGPDLDIVVKGGTQSTSSKDHSMYLKSLNEAALSGPIPQVPQGTDYEYEYDLTDPFLCRNNEVEYENKAGDFTQAMTKARIKLRSTDSSKPKRPATRRSTMAEKAMKASNIKKRKRIFAFPMDENKSSSDSD